MLYLAIATIYSLFDHVYKYMGDQLCAKKILNNHWISGVPILKGLIRILKSLKFCLVNTETTVKIIWRSVFFLNSKQLRKKLNFYTCNKGLLCICLHGELKNVIQPVPTYTVLEIWTFFSQLVNPNSLI